MGSRFSWEAAGTCGRQQVLVVGSRFSWEATGAREDRPVGLSVPSMEWRAPYGKDGAVLIGFRGIRFMGMHLHGNASHRRDCAESGYQ